MTINHFLNIFQAHSQRNFGFLIPGISKGEIGTNDKLNIYFKSNCNLLIMNVTQLIFFIDKMYIYYTLLKLTIRKVVVRKSAHINFL